MVEKIFSLCDELRTLLNEKEEIKLLNEIENEMNTNEEVLSLVYKKDIISSEYSDILKYSSEDSELAQNKLKELHQAKLNLDNHPLVEKYRKYYARVIIIYKEVNDILFKDFKTKKI
jgi:cell fate (sporulation/competence/biofilm development) regulator YlbF (YheA/YmcA/DUF963 family)